MDGRREMARWKIGRSVKLKIGPVDEITEGYIKDLSLGGMCLVLPRKMSSNGLLKVDLQLTHDLDVELSVMFPWIKEQQGHYVHGISFKKISNEDRDKIFLYINTYGSQELQDLDWPKTL